MNHYYAFEQKARSPIPYYERTFGTESAARKWAGKKPGRFITINSLPRRSWY